MRSFKGDILLSWANYFIKCFFEIFASNSKKLFLGIVARFYFLTFSELQGINLSIPAEIIRKTIFS